LAVAFSWPALPLFETWQNEHRIMLRHTLNILTGAPRKAFTFPSGTI
jgi:hypothetical protein